MRGAHRGVCCSKSTPLIEAELFAATAFAPCTGWPRTVMRGKLRKLTSGHNSLPKPARRTEPSPRNPRFAAQPKGVAAQRRVWGSQEGAREPYGALFPFCPAAGRRHSHAMSWRISPARGGPDSPPPAAPLDRRKSLPPADDKVFKDLQSLLQRLFLKSLAFHPAVRYNKTTRRGKAFTSRIFLTALSLRKGAKAIRTAGSNAEHGNFVALLNFYKLAD